MLRDLLTVQQIARKPRLAWFADLPTSISESTASHWTSTILPLLERSFEIEVFSDASTADLQRPAFPYQIAAMRHKNVPFDCFVYQLEDVKSANFSRIHLGLIPGIVIFHDFVLGSDGPEQILNSPWRKTIELFSAYQDNGINPPWPPLDSTYKPSRPYAKREAGMALIPIFSSACQHAQFEREVDIRISGKGTPSYYLPHPIIDYGSARSMQAESILFCGSPQRDKRAHQVLAALAHVQAPFRFRWLVSDQSERRQAQSLLDEFGIGSGELVEGRTVASWAELISSGGIALHLHFGMHGQVGPYLGQSLMAGLPVAVSNYGDGEILPAGVAFKIDPGHEEVLQLRALFERLLSKNSPLRGIDCASTPARAYAMEMHACEVVAAELTGIILRNCESLTSIGQTWRAFEGTAAHQVVSENLAPPGSVHSSNGLRPAFSFERLAHPIFEELGWFREGGRYGM